MEEIDFVVTWVDGNDARLNELRLKYWQEQTQTNYSPKPNPPPGQYANSEEIIYCLASILRNAPFARRVHLIVDQQRPRLEDLEDFGFNKADLAKISIVDHKEIFTDFLDLTPTFNSLSIESLIHRTPGLADHFVYMNDDFFILKTTSPSDYFAAPKTPIMHGEMRLYSQAYLRLKLWLLQIWGQHKQPRWSFVNGCMNAALTANLLFRYLRLYHSPSPIYKPLLDHFFNSHPKFLRKNAKHRFRHYRQFLPQALAACLSLKAGKLRLNSDTSSVGYITPNMFSRIKLKDNPPETFIKNRKQGRSHIQVKDARFLCIQNLEQASENQRDEIFALLRSALTRYRPDST